MARCDSNAAPVCVCFMGLSMSLFHTVFPLKWWQLWACSAIIPRIHTHIDTDRESSQTPTGSPGLPVPAPTIGSIVPVRLQSAECDEECVCVPLASVERWGQNLTNWRHFVIGDAKMGSWYPLSSEAPIHRGRSTSSDFSAAQVLALQAVATWDKEGFQKQIKILHLRNMKWIQIVLRRLLIYTH